MAEADVARIVSTPGVLDGEPRVEGRRVSVRVLHEQVEGRGRDPKIVATEYDLDVATVYRALAYYHEHPSEMAKIERERERLVGESADASDVVTGPDDR